MDQPIVLTTTAEEIRALYFKHDRFDVLRSVDTLIARRHFLWTALIAIVLGAIAWAHGKAYVLYWIAIVGLLAKGIELIVSFNRIWRQRRVVDAWARAVEKAGPAKLWTSEQGFTLLYDGKESIERWSAVTHATVGDDHLHLRASTTYLFPKSSMRSEEFSDLVLLARRKLSDTGDALNTVARDPT